MAKINNTMTFKNAKIDKEKNTITETLKDDVKIYDLNDVINAWNLKENISITFKKEADIEPIN